METSVCRLILAVLFAVLAVTQANYFALPRMGRSGYIAFPRLGRGYLAFPRLGRSQPTGSDAADDSPACCPVGLKTEWILGDGGKTEVHNVCPTESACCGRLQEVLDQKPDGTFYSLCIPSCSGEVSSSDANQVLLAKLKGLLQN